MTLLAAFQILLAQHSGQDDIVVGSPIAGRNRLETENLIGHFINTLVLRTSLAGDPSFSELLTRVREVALGAYANQETPFEKLVEALQPERNLNSTPLFQVMFVFQNAAAPELTLKGLTITKEELHGATAPLELTLEARETADGIRCVLEYQTDLFDAGTIETLARRFQLLLERAVVDAAQPVSRLTQLTESEQQLVVVSWNNTAREYARDRCIQQLFEAQVVETPETTAVVCKDQSLSYRELNKRANQLAHSLRARGVGAESLVGICVERSLEMIVAVLGVLKAGGAYVPLDPGYPRERLNLILQDAGVSLVLSQERLTGLLSEFSGAVLCVDDRPSPSEEQNVANPVPVTDAENLAYVIYTSGSTGVPKGVMIAHRSLVNFTMNAQADYDLGAADRVLQFASLNFDTSAEEIFPCLTSGATLVLRTEEMLDSVGGFLRACDELGVTVLDLPTAYWHEVAAELDQVKLSLPEKLRLLIIGGERALPERFASWRQRAGAQVRLVNTYGPTEATIVATKWEAPLPKATGELVELQIGRPLGNVTAYLLDPKMNPVPIGVSGELYLGGEGLARGYLNRPALTAEKFVCNPFEANSRLYQTGDLARYLPNGDLEYLGRSDEQVKLRGFRIELGDIESALRQHPSVRDCVVVVRAESPDQKRLVGYVVTVAETPVDTRELRAFLRNKLPEYMVPAVLMMIERLPLTPSGKVNRRALPAPGHDAQQQDSFVPPRTPIEELLASTWAEVLQLPRVGINDNFFELGGHSLLAVRLFARIEKICGKHLPLATLFQAPTVAQLAELLHSEGWTAPWSPLVAIQPRTHSEADRRPLFCVHPLGGNVIEYYDLARYLGPDQPFYAFQSVGLDGQHAPHTTVPEMATHYLKEMRRVQPAGPYLLGGHSLGGAIAFEMACQLQAAGEEVDLLALFDAYPIGHYKLQPNWNSRSFHARRYAKRLKCHIDNLRSLKGSSRLTYLAGKVKFAPDKIKQQIWRRAYRGGEFNSALPKTLRNIEGVNFLAAREFVPSVYAGGVTLFWASGDLTTSFDLVDGWHTLAAGGVELHEIPGSHINLLKAPHVQALADELRACLDQAQKNQLPGMRAA
jgi:aspartate racemase